MIKGQISSPNGALFKNYSGQSFFYIKIITPRDFFNQKFHITAIQLILSGTFVAGGAANVTTQ